MSMDLDRIEIRHPWSDALLRESNIMSAQSIDTGGYWAGMMPGIVVGLISFSAISTLYSDQFGAVIGIFTGYFANGIAGDWAQRRLMKRFVKQSLLAPTKAGETVLTIDHTGIRIDHPLHETLLRWASVMDLISGPLALHVIVGPNQSIPLPDRGLPDGVTREDLRRDIQIWRDVET